MLPSLKIWVCLVTYHASGGQERKGEEKMEEDATYIWYNVASLSLDYIVHSL